MKLKYCDLSVGDTVVLWQKGVGAIGEVISNVQHGFCLRTNLGDEPYSTAYVEQFGRNMTLELNELGKL